MDTGPKDVKLFSCSTELSMNLKIYLLIKTKMLKNKDFAFTLPYTVFIILTYVKMSTIVGILTLMKMMNFMLTCV